MMDGYPESELPNLGGPGLDSSGSDLSWLSLSSLGPPAEISKDDTLPHQFYSSTTLASWPATAGALTEPGNHGIDELAVTGLDPSLSFPGFGLRPDTMADNFLQDQSHSGNAPAAWEFGGTTQAGPFGASMPGVMSSPEWSTLASSVLVSPSDWQAISPSLTPGTSAFGSPSDGGAHQGYNPSTVSGTSIPSPPPSEAAAYLPLKPLTPAKENPKQSKRRKRVAEPK